MKKLMIACFVLAFVCSATVKAQGILDRIDRGLDKADRASRTADRSKTTGDKISGFFKKKDKGTEKEDKETSKTVIQVSGIDLSALKKLNGRIETCKSVEETESKFNSTASTITVNHTGSTEELYELLSKSVDDVFNDKNVDALEKGKISIHLKKE